MKIKKIRRFAYLLSILFHLLLIILFQKAERLDLLFSKNPEPVEPVDNRLVFQLIETPEDSPIEEPAESTDLVSDKSTAARDQEADELSGLDLPFNEGETEFKEFQQPETVPIPEIVQIEEQFSDNEKESEETRETDLQEELLSLNESGKEGSEETILQQQQDNSNKLNFKNLISDAAQQGAISFNTYNWDFAPYMLAMKKTIESNWNPPFAFTHMGAISGVNRFRFTVLPDGRVKNIQMLESNAHYSLDQSSSMAIEGSSPFMPLPQNFPEENLIVTVTFSYNILKNKR
jgi:TonB family protein